MLLQQLIDQDRDFMFHWKCRELGLFQSCFADDLVLFCEANEQSISLFKRGLEMFASLSGLHVNPKKSHLILSKSAQHNSDRLLRVLGFQEAHLPVLYLGFPLISSRLSLSDCKPLLLKIYSRIRDWGGLQLSFAARVQLIKLVLVSFNIYWAIAFLLPKGVIGKLNNSCGLSYGMGLREMDTGRSHGIKYVSRLRKGVKGSGTSWLLTLLL
ncbi:UNVERIFIED_CONTAM: hypothetical protein Sangu_1863100 [Sesamum angustifolium]|uniref:Reverse transcriptase domain-containing protein n=1 Tax=Sesamum angustifolium TaxID=2727405 RepID=A0AAW2LUM0_9LAMI